MFQKILIANRGEIACRIIKTARRLGIQTVAVYSAADRDALHVSLADEAIPIGPPPASDSYLRMDNIIQACRTSGADAVHPGYGFLSENAEFAHRVGEAGITFIGPTVQAIRSMGDKVRSKQLAREAGVNTIPGRAGIIDSAADAVAVAGELGYPVMLKASAGGGGKGMRVARNDDECRAGFTAARNEARTAFADERVFLEKFIEQPRHIEIQVLADKHQHVIHLGERECSLQRRHQKVIEEAPSPFLDAAARSAMGDQAVALARAVAYESAGTVEFIVDPEHNFYFLEMNTRLQVEHPVTELVTGLDLVELMIRIAAGECLPLCQTDVRLDGWAIEARVYAEDPARGFLPAVGRLVRYLPPRESDHLRVDSGVYEGGEVSLYYDPLIAKLITHDKTRDHATFHLREALNQFYIRGVAHNISFLAALIEHPRFGEARLSTNLIGEEYPQGFDPSAAGHDDPALLIVVAADIHRRYLQRASGISGQLAGYEPAVDKHWVVVMNGAHYAVEIEPTVDGHEVRYDGKRYSVRSDWQFGQPLFSGTVNDQAVHVRLERHNMVYRLFHRGCQRDIMVLTARAAELLACMPAKRAPQSGRFLLSPMPGLLTQLRVDEGHQVRSGQDLAVVEAMKMENVLRAERDGTVMKLLATVGDTLAVEQPIIEFD